MPKQLNVRVSDLQFSALDEAVAGGRFPSRAAALRHALELLLTEPEPEEITVTDAESAPDEVAEAVDAAQERAEGGGPDGPDADDVAARVPQTTSTPEAGDAHAGDAEADDGVTKAVAAHPALIEQRAWDWAQERRLPALAEQPALRFARRAAVPVLSGAAGALLATVLRGIAARREGPRGPVHLFVVTRRA